jgi:hypothetical protein
MGDISPWLQVAKMGMRDPAGTRSTRDGDLHGEMMVVSAPDRGPVVVASPVH